jgi:nucleoid-associated protein YgaU
VWVNTKSRNNKLTAYLNTVTVLTVTYNVYIVREGDTMAMVANRFYGDTTKWWVIADANPHIFQPFIDLKPGAMLRVPQ